MPWIFEKNCLAAPTGRIYPAISGPYGKGELPSGEYIIGRPVEIKSSLPKFDAYRDKSGLAWWCRLAPCFKTKRFGFGIHPDGNVPGTRGCIGIVLDDTRPVFQTLKNTEDKILLVIDDMTIE
jgi:hypothetical protein